MIENFKRIREPLSWAMIAVIVAQMLLGVLRLILLLSAGEVPVFAAFQDIGDSLLNLTAVLALVALVCTCFFMAPAVPGARFITQVAAWVVTIGVVLSLVASMLGVAASAGTIGVMMELFGSLLDLLLKALAAGSLWVLLRGVGSGRIDIAPPVEARPVAPSLETPTQRPESAAVWQRSEATGAAWRTAQAAAQGDPGSTSIAGDPEPNPKA